MSTTIKDYYDNAQLAEASYSILNKNISETEFIEALKLLQGEKYSNAQASLLVQKYEVKHAIQNTDTGFSATLFKEADGTTYTIAIRGTEIPDGITDDVLLTDIGDIGGDGIAIKQAIDLFNYYQQLITPEGDDALQLKFSEGLFLPEGAQIIETTESANSTTYSYIEVIAPVKGLGEIPVDAKINVAGHSLGGHLALILSRLDPEHINEVYTYNAPGFDTGLVGSDETEDFFNAISILQAQEQGISTVLDNGFPDYKLNNLVIPLDVVSDIGDIPGTQIGHFGEAQNIVSAHFMAGVVDSLAVYNLLSDLTSKGLNELTPLFDVSSNQASNDIESLVNSLGKVLGFGKEATSDNRDSLYQRIEAIYSGVYVDAASQNPILKPEYSILEIVSVNSLISSANIDNFNGYAYRYALVNLNPFAIVDKTDSLYNSHNIEGQLDADKFSEEYLADRAYVYSQFLSRNVADGILVPTTDNSQQEYYKDYLTNQNAITTKVPVGTPQDQIRSFIFGDENGNSIKGGEQNDRLYGGGGVDNIQGAAGSDYLEGNNDSDILLGGEGGDEIHGGQGNDFLFASDIDNTNDGIKDSLYGGKGNDKFFLNAGDEAFDTEGNDHYIINTENGNATVVIDDTDRQGTLEIDGYVIRLGFSTEENQWESTLHTLSRVGTSLIISREGHADVEIKNFTNGDFGISLYQEYSTTPDPTDVSLSGDLAYQDFDSEEEGIQTGTDNLGNIIQAPETFEEQEDYLRGSQDADYINTGALNDTVKARAGNDFVEGGTGSDIIQGGDGNDHLYAGTQSDLEKVIQGDSLDTTTDWVAGESGDDLIVGSDGINGLTGGEGKDVIYAGDGADIIFGDSHRVAANHEDWFELNNGVISQYYINYGEPTTHNPEGADNDVIYAGEGNDLVYGQGKNDVIYGDGGNDLIDGDISSLSGAQHGDDIIYGGEGNDGIVGNGGHDTLYGGIGDDNLNGDAAFGLAGEYHGNDSLNGGEGNDNLVGAGADDILHGGIGNDALHGDMEDGLASEYHGNDYLYAGEGHDLLVGHKGDDLLSGGSGNDVYEFRIGDGNDTIIDQHGIDTIRFTDGTQAHQVKAERLEGGDTILHIYGKDGIPTGDTIRIVSTSESSVIENIQFEEGEGPDTSLALADLGDLSTAAAAESGLEFFDILSISSGTKPLTSFRTGPAEKLFEEGYFGDIHTLHPYYIDGGVLLRSGFNLPAGTSGAKYNLEDDKWYYSDKPEGEPIEPTDTVVPEAEQAAFNQTRSASLAVINKDWSDYFENYPPVTPFPSSPSFSNSESLTSPIALDLDGDGLETLAKSYGTFFDHDNNGLAEQTGWIASDDGLLVRDLNGDGVINGGSELFGNNTTLQNGSLASNGYEALIQLDDNTDSVIDSLDAAYTELRIWKDLNSDGVSQANELLTLEEAGVSSISTNYQTVDITDAQGNTVKQLSSTTLIDGSVNVAADVWFDNDLTHTRTVENLELSEAIKALPNVKGFGNVHNLDQAMARDAELQALVEQFVSESDDSSRRAMLNDLIYQWAGVADVDPHSRNARLYGHVMDARQLETLEALVGRGYLGTWCWGERDPNPHGRAAPVLIAQYQDFKSFVYAQLMAGSHYEEAFSQIGVRYDSESDTFLPDMSDFTTYLKSLADAGDIAEVSKIYGALKGLGGYSSAYKDAAVEVKADPELGPLIVDNIIEGTVADDTLSGTNADDLLIGGLGDDTLLGRAGDDTYVFELGDGADRIYDSAGSDTISFGPDITLNSIQVTRNATTLFITLLDSEGNPTSDRIQIDNVFDFDGSIQEGAIERFNFDDDTTVDLNGVIALIEQTPTDGDDVLYGTLSDDTFEALKGNDTIYGGAGDDTYRFAPGDGMDTIFENAGTDTIEFTGGILPDQVKIVRTGPEGEDLLLKLYDAEGNETGDSITVVKAYQSYAASGNRIEQVSFTLADGSVQVMTLDDLEKIYDASPLDDVIYGFESDDTISALSGIDEVHGAGGNDTLMGDEDDDTLYGEAGDDLLIGGHGNDLLNGGSGNDRYFFASGDGHDVIDNRDSSSFDVLEFDSSVNPSKVRIFRVDNDLFISIDRNTDSVQVKNFFNGDVVSSTALKEIRFADGSVMTVQDVIDLTLEATQQADFITAFSSDDTIAARGGDDIVYAKSGDDMVSGDQGNDLLFGENGNDLLFGQQGADQIYGGQGDDVAYGGNESDSLYGSSGQDNLYGGNDSDLLYGGSQNDNLYGENGTDTLYGEHGDDTLSGGDGDDVLDGGVGNDIYTGGLGDDTYIYAQGDGDDLIETGKKEVNGHDTLSLDGFSTDQIWLSQQGDDLLVNFVGNNGQVLIEDWALDHDVVDEIQVDGFSASGEDIERLVSAMAAFDAPSGAGEVLSQDVKDQLQPVLAASWHSAA